MGSCFSSSRSEQIQAQKKEQREESKQERTPSAPENKSQKQSSQKIQSSEEHVISTANFVRAEKGKIRQFYKIGDVIGDGAFGKVRKAVHLQTGAPRAIKTISKESVEKHGELTKFFAEVDILRKIDHPNILALYEFYEDEKNYHLVTELCTGGELFDRIIEKGKFNESMAAQIMHQVLSAMVYCHSNMIVHRDLKPENLLLESAAEDAPIKVIDFGTSQFFDANKKMTQKQGTPYYIAPEVLKRKYDEKCDIWSSGVILYILLCGYPPFAGANDEIILSKVSRGQFSFDDPI